MTADGVATYYKVQHVGQNGDWVGTALDECLFRGLTWSVRSGPKGDFYRELLEPQSATSDLWQNHGIHGFAEKVDAAMVLRAVKRENPEMRLRLVCIRISQTTTAVDV
jgi:hypothetical protein